MAISDTPGPFWQIDQVALERQLGGGPNGLTNAEVAARRLRYGANSLETKRRYSLLLKVLSRFRNPLVLVLLFAASISAATGDLTSFLIVASLVILSVVFDSVQEYR